jgi:putative Mg2+ transporter-C (MgtC) family protein
MPDVLRVIAGIATGVGFLGTGVIIFKDTELTGGLTTAAGLWVAAGIGVAAGFQFYSLAVIATFLTLIVFTIFWYLERGVERVAGGEKSSS